MNNKTPIFAPPTKKGGQFFRGLAGWGGLMDTATGLWKLIDNHPRKGTETNKQSGFTLEKNNLFWLIKIPLHLHSQNGDSI